MERVYGFWVALFAVTLFAAGPVKASSLVEELAHGLVNELNESPFADDFKYKNKQIEGTWGDRETWDGTLCDGYYSYSSRLRAHVQEIKADITSDLTIPITADFDSIVAAISGVYRSEWSLCAQVKAGHQIRVDSASARAQATIVEGKDGGAPTIKVRVLETRFGRIHFTEVLPDWFEEWMTNQVNKGMRVVWNSRLGEWISEWLSQKINEKFPGGGEN